MNKSYMNTAKILDEGFFQKIKSFIKSNKLTQTMSLRKDINNLNTSISKLEKSLSKEAGRPVKLEKIKLSDFF